MNRRPTEAGIKKLRNEAKKIGDIRFSDRCQIILFIFVYGWSAPCTAKTLNISPATARKWKNRYIESGVRGDFMISSGAAGLSRYRVK